MSNDTAVLVIEAAGTTITVLDDDEGGVVDLVDNETPITIVAEAATVVPGPAGPPGQLPDLPSLSLIFENHLI